MLGHLQPKMDDLETPKCRRSSRKLVVLENVKRLRPAEPKYFKCARSLLKEFERCAREEERLQKEEIQRRSIGCA